MALANVVEIQNGVQHILEVELTALADDWNKESIFSKSWTTII